MTDLTVMVPEKMQHHFNNCQKEGIKPSGDFIFRIVVEDLGLFVCGGIGEQAFSAMQF